MKRIVCFILIAVTVCTLSACSNNENKPAGTGSADNTKAVSQSTEIKESKTDDNNVVDLTALSSTMVYSELYNMVTMPDDYIGKTVKMQGKYSVYDGEGRKYYVCEVSDATACCSQGLEFILKDGEKYPEYDSTVPKTIEISGTFNTYLEDNQQYVQLEEATLTVL